MKDYISTKQISAKPMTRGQYNEYRGWTTPNNENPDDAGYFIRRYNGYETWMEANAFEEEYEDVDKILEEENATPTDFFDFSYALECLKQEERVSRENWGKGFYLYALPKLLNEKTNNWLVFSTPNGEEVYSPSQEDLVAENWYVVE